MMNESTVESEMSEYILTEILGMMGDRPNMVFQPRILCNGRVKIKLERVLELLRELDDAGYLVFVEGERPSLVSIVARPVTVRA